MAQASVLNNQEIRRLFAVIETTKHAARNRLAFGLSIYSGLRVGEIAHLRIGDVANSDGEPRREIKLAAHQTKGSRGRTVIVSSRVQAEIRAFLKDKPLDPDAPLIASQKGGFFSPQTLCMLFKEIYEMAGLNTSSHSGRRSFATRLNSKGVGMRTIQKLMGHKHIATTSLYCDVSDEQMRNAVDLI
jgi:integrase/recombinase XerD